MDKARKFEIERQSRELLGDILNNQHKLWPNGMPDLVNAIDLEVICRYLGFTLDEHHSLGKFSGLRFEVAGAIDQKRKIISISGKFRPEIRRFTAAHEIGHLILHPSDTVMHRDMPVEDQSERPRLPLIEREANYFSSCLLMPRNVLEKEFTKRFGRKPFHFNENACHHLAGRDFEELLYSEPDTLAREIKLASFEIPGVKPLAKLFRVSNSAMAIRLNELGFVKYP